jgi:hypothetical protein
MEMVPSQQGQLSQTDLLGSPSFNGTGFMHLSSSNSVQIQLLLGEDLMYVTD